MSYLVVIPALVQAVAFFLTLEHLGNGLSVLVNVIPRTPQAGLAGLLMLLPFGIACVFFLGVSYGAAAITAAGASFLIRRTQAARGRSFGYLLAVAILFAALNVLAFAIAAHLSENPMRLPPKALISSSTVYAALTIGGVLNAVLAALIFRSDASLGPAPALGGSRARSSS
jgi:hypothetical protein